MTEELTLRGVVAEDFVNYKKPSMFLITSYCDFKCCTEAGVMVCQNQPLVTDTEIKSYSIDNLLKIYLANDITKAVVFGGLEPFMQFDEVYSFVHKLRWECNCFDDVVIYTGYTPEEVVDKISALNRFNNVIVKFGRFIPNQEAHYDELLGVNLQSDNQYAERIS